jgi:hypothetical protein
MTGARHPFKRETHPLKVAGPYPLPCRVWPPATSAIPHRVRTPSGTARGSYAWPSKPATGQAWSSKTIGGWPRLWALTSATTTGMGSGSLRCAGTPLTGCCVGPAGPGWRPTWRGPAPPPDRHLRITLPQSRPLGDAVGSAYADSRHSGCGSTVTSRQRTASWGNLRSVAVRFCICHASRSGTRANAEGAFPAGRLTSLSGEMGASHDPGSRPSVFDRWSDTMATCGLRYRPR